MSLTIFIFRNYVLWTPTLLTFYKIAPVWKRLARICLSRSGSNIYICIPRIYLSQNAALLDGRKMVSPTNKYYRPIHWNTLTE